MVLLVSELESVVDWFHLGLYLGLSPPELEAIRADKQGQTKDCRSAMFTRWIDNTVEPTWSDIVTALVGIGKKSLAHKITIKYGTRAYNIALVDEKVAMVPQNILSMFMLTCMLNYHTTLCMY